MKSRVTGMNRSGLSEAVKRGLQNGTTPRKPRFQNTCCSKRALAMYHFSRTTMP